MRHVLASCTALAIAGAPATAARSDWTGSAACGTCHPTQLAAWRTTRHATTASRLPPRPAARCLACHGTGDAPAGAAIAVEVGCEACHGAGAAYAAEDLMLDRELARMLGLADVTTSAARTALCAGCHRGSATRLAPIDLTAAAHPVSP